MITEKRRDAANEPFTLYTIQVEGGYLSFSRNNTPDYDTEMQGSFLFEGKFRSECGCFYTESSFYLDKEQARDLAVAIIKEQVIADVI